MLIHGNSFLLGIKHELMFFLFVFGRLVLFVARWQAGLAERTPRDSTSGPKVDWA